MRKPDNNLLLPVSTNFIVLSSYHNELAPDINGRNHEQLRFNLVNLGYSIIELRASYRIVSAIAVQAEKIFFVRTGQLYEELLLGKKYNQAALLYKTADKISVLDTDVGRELWTYNFCNYVTADDFKIVFTEYLFIKNGGQNISDVVIEKLHIPTKLESLLRLKNKQPLAQTEWIELY
jgi:hypothetical protein